VPPLGTIRLSTTTGPSVPVQRVSSALAADTGTRRAAAVTVMVRSKLLIELPSFEAATGEGGIQKPERGGIVDPAPFLDVQQHGRAPAVAPIVGSTCWVRLASRSPYGRPH